MGRRLPANEMPPASVVAEGLAILADYGCSIEYADGGRISVVGGDTQPDNDGLQWLPVPRATTADEIERERLAWAVRSFSRMAPEDVLRLLELGWRWGGRIDGATGGRWAFSNLGVAQAEE